MNFDLNLGSPLNFLPFSISKTGFPQNQEVLGRKPIGAAPCNGPALGAESNSRLFQSTTAWCPSFDSVLKAVALNSRVEGLKRSVPETRRERQPKRPWVFGTTGEIRVKKHLTHIHSLKRGGYNSRSLSEKNEVTKKFGLVPNLSRSPITYHKPLIKDERFVWTHLSLKSTTGSKSKDIKVSSIVNALICL